MSIIFSSNSFIPCAERIYVAVSEMAALFPKVCTLSPHLINAIKISVGCLLDFYLDVYWPQKVFGHLGRTFDQILFINYLNIQYIISSRSSGSSNIH